MESLGEGNLCRESHGLSKCPKMLGEDHSSSKGARNERQTPGFQMDSTIHFMEAILCILGVDLMNVF